MTRRIMLNLYCHQVAKEYTECDVEEAKRLLRKRMAPGWRWGIAPPDRTGELPDDEARFAADCEACGVTNPYANV